MLIRVSATSITVDLEPRTSICGRPAKPVARPSTETARMRRMTQQSMNLDSDARDVTRRGFLHTSLAAAAGMAIGGDGILAAPDRDTVVAEIAKQHDATLKMLRDWIALPSIAAENLNYPQGADYMAKLARDAGFGKVDVVRTKGKPGVFAKIGRAAGRGGEDR